MQFVDKARIFIKAGDGAMAAPASTARNMWLRAARTAATEGGEEA